MTYRVSNNYVGPYFPQNKLLEVELNILMCVEVVELL